MNNKLLQLRFVALVTTVMCALGVQAAEAYACYTPSNTTLTFYYDNLRSSRTGTTYSLNTGYNDPGWLADGTNFDVKRVIFDPSFADARPTTTCYWFCDMSNLSDIIGLYSLNTSQVTNMSGMFVNCSSLTHLYFLDYFDTYSFYTSNVTDMMNMFAGCNNLTSIDVTRFNTSKVTNMFDMFYNCCSLTSLDVSSFNTAQVTNMGGMFSSCSNLTTIYAGSDWSTAALNNTSNVFNRSTKLVGGKGTTYDENHTGAEYAHIDGGPNNPGYFSEKPAYLRGDVNGDNVVNIADVMALIDYLLSGNATGINLAAANCNLDNAVNIADVTSLIDYLLSGSW